MPDFLFGAIVGAIWAVIVFAGIMVSLQNNIMNRALSCMAAGNTVVQCQDILGITK